MRMYLEQERRKIVWGPRIVLALVLLALAFGANAYAQQPPGDEFVPVNQLPAQEQLPAAPLVMAAYAIAWIAVFGYLWSIWQRLNRVERDIAEVGRRIDAGARR